MKVAIMQPYLFPYIGYFQLIRTADQFIIGDSVQYIQSGWINRNRILANGEPHLVTFPVIKDSSYLTINQRFFNCDDRLIQKNIKLIYHAYHKSPYFKVCYELIQEILNYPNKNVAEYILNSLKEICSYIGMDVKMMRESELGLPPELKFQDAVIYMCKKLNATQYINSIGGMNLYSFNDFKDNGILLRFLKTRESIRYNQFNDTFVPDLSIIDVMMFNSPQEIQSLLNEYDLINGIN